jgi:murein DD-endopeptidase MepM/ murein hydrolase activator NlpD
MMPTIPVLLSSDVVKYYHIFHVIIITFLKARWHPMAWKNDVRDRTREWGRPSKSFQVPVKVPLWVWQGVACLFVFFLVYGASQAQTGLAADVAVFARDSTNKDLSFAQVKAWAQAVPAGIVRLVSVDIRNFWSRAVTGRQTELAWPASGQITSYFGWRPNTQAEGMSLHQGIDIDAPKGTKVACALDGVVKSVRTSPEYGLVVEVEHAGGLSSVYGHLDSASVTEAQRVKKGDALGTVGESGNATGPHLHFEVRKDGLEVDPMTILPPVKGT